MIAYIKGKIISKNNNSVVCLISGIGYRVFCGEDTLNTLSLGAETELHIYQSFKENASDLYGFLDIAELDVFSLLLSVSGVGPKSAIGVLSTSTASDVSEAIMRDDAELLTKVAGIGKKTAERIVLELKTKISRLSINSGFNQDNLLVSSDEIDALMALGYSLQEARIALAAVAKDVVGSGERVKAALKKMKKI